ncbi:SMI1/KNR4 family protein [Kosakonia cowanii]|uniref:SMI1/KNR4 family protein n=1 Tax=Kosakonia cowanii TaxID=208223 RepID=UPI0023F8A2C9|nr:SMI1/KNR4 family protein [Kosakonia cowanii]MDF7759016.1 SMI1/KNR4 family protein [Kosakonia cowanii]
MYLSDTEQKLTREEMASFNALFDNLLPQSFLDFYLENNGGYPLNNEDGNFFLLGGFNPVKYGELPIEQLYNDLTEHFRELRKMVPFAHDEGGELFLVVNKPRGFFR